MQECSSAAGVHAGPCEGELPPGPEESRPPRLPPRMCPYIAVALLPESGWRRSPHPTGHTQGACHSLGPGLTLRIVLSSQPGVSCWFGKLSPGFTVPGQKYNPPVWQEPRAFGRCPHGLF